MTTPTLQELPEPVQKLIANLRKESSDYRRQRTAARGAAADARSQAARYRVQRNEARAEVAQLRAELEARSK